MNLVIQHDIDLSRLKSSSRRSFKFEGNRDLVDPLSRGFLMLPFLRSRESGQFRQAHNLYLTSRVSQSSELSSSSTLFVFCIAVMVSTSPSSFLVARLISIPDIMCCLLPSYFIWKLPGAQIPLMASFSLA